MKRETATESCPTPITKVALAASAAAGLTVGIVTAANASDSPTSSSTDVSFQDVAPAAVSMGDRSQISAVYDIQALGGPSPINTDSVVQLGTFEQATILAAQNDAGMICMLLEIPQYEVMGGSCAPLDDFRETGLKMDVRGPSDADDGQYQAYLLPDGVETSAVPEDSDLVELAPGLLVRSVANSTLQAQSSEGTSVVLPTVDSGESFDLELMSSGMEGY